MVEDRRLRLRLERVIEAPADRVFAAVVEPAALAAWWGPIGFTTPHVDLDAREGGRYRFTMQPPEGEAFHLRGRFVEVEPARRLVFTFEWEEPDPDDRETVVELALVEHERGTRIVLDQGDFATEARLALHRDGWTETLERLARFLG